MCVNENDVVSTEGIAPVSTAGDVFVEPVDTEEEEGEEE